METGMNKSIQIYKRDIKNIVINGSSAIIILGLIILPSLYAWLNIAASWDPYGKTNQIPVAIVNEDQGATAGNRSFNAGKELVEQLKGNHDMDWKFTTRTKALDRLNNGDYFSVIIIPKGFSKELATVTSGQPQRAKMDYFVNEKINSIAPKITSKGASVLVESMSSKFIGTVNGIIFDIMNRLGVTMQEELPDIENFKNLVFTLERDLPSIFNKLQRAQKDLNSAGQILQKAKKDLPEAKALTQDGLSTINQTLTFINNAETKINSLKPQVRNDVEKIQHIATSAQDLITALNNDNFTPATLTDMHNKLNQQASTALERLTAIHTALTTLQQNSNDQQTTEDRQALDKALQQTANAQQAMETLQQNIQSNTDQVQGLSQRVGKLREFSDTALTGLTNFTNEFDNVIQPTIDSHINHIKEMLTGTKGILTDIQSTFPEITRLLNVSDSTLASTNQGLQKAIADYPLIHSRVQKLANQIRSFEKETNLNSVIQLLINNPTAEKTFFEEPIKMKEHRVFPIPNYGTGMAPFYSVLAIWVGGLLLVSLLATDVEDKQYTVREVYFGKLLTFWTIGLLQALIIVLGDLFLLKVSVQAPLPFLLFSLFISIVFMTIVYTLVSVFGNIGKALSIVLLVLQLAGSGGTYPVVLLPKFFQIINPYLPFTYAISLARESIGGIIWQKVILDLTFLGGVLLFILLFGSIFKKQMQTMTLKMTEKSRKSGLFH